MKKKEIFPVIKQDFVRAVLSWKFVISIILGVVICYFTVAFCGNYKSETIHKFIMLHDRSQSFLAYIAGILPYALCIYDDFTCGNIKNVLGRINVKHYILSKNVIAILTTIVAFTLGKFLFVCLYSIDSPICTNETLTRIPTSILYIDMIYNKNYIGYLLMSSFHKSLYCGILCQLVMITSMLIPNKSVTFTVPIAVFYVVNFYVNNRIGSSALNFTRIFDGITRLGTEDYLCLGYAILVALVSYYVLYRVSFYILKRKVYE